MIQYPSQNKYNSFSSHFTLFLWPACISPSTNVQNLKHFLHHITIFLQCCLHYHQHTIDFLACLMRMKHLHSLKSVSLFSSISVKQSRIAFSSSLPPDVLFPRRYSLWLFLLYRETAAHLLLLFESTRAWHLHVPSTRLLIEDWVHLGVVKGVIAGEVRELVGLFLSQGLVARGLGGSGSGVFFLFWPLFKRVKIWAKGMGGTCVLVASALFLWR